MSRAGSRTKAGASFLLLWILMVRALPSPCAGEVSDLTAGQWSGGGGLGFLGSTPDGIAEFAVKGQADYFITPGFSVGPLAQYAGIGNDFMFGLSAQAKGWWTLPRTDGRLKLVLQGGVGFISAGIKDTDSRSANTYGSFLVPLGTGLDYAVTPNVAVTADFIVNLTSLGETVRVNGREFDLHTNVMPAFYIGVRF